MQSQYNDWLAKRYAAREALSKAWSEGTQARGETIRGVTLYELMVERWLSRDDGKHCLLKEDKVRLMEDLARSMERDGAREWPWERVLEWYGHRLAEDPVLQHRYGSKDPDVS